tara:strand:- start:5268 stop:6185 length:918 start_codon:yes stop_codon:yes gene_type:complete
MSITTYAELKTAIQNWPERDDAQWTDRVDEFLDLAESSIRQDPEFRPRGMEAYIDLVIQKAKSGGTVGGTANAITLTLLSDDTISSLTLGTVVELTATATNTDETTLNVDGTGATNVRKNDGSSDVGKIEANDIIIGHTYQFYYDGTVWRLLPSPGAVPLPSRYHGIRSIFIDTDPDTPLSFLPPEYFHSRLGSSSTAKPKFYTIENEYIIFGPQTDVSRAVKLNYYRGMIPLDSTNTTNWFTNNAVHLLLYKCLAIGYAKIDDDKNSLKYQAWYESSRDDIKVSDKRDRRSAVPQKRAVGVNIY